MKRSRVQVQAHRKKVDFVWNNMQCKYARQIFDVAKYGRSDSGLRFEGSMESNLLCYKSRVVLMEKSKLGAPCIRRCCSWLDKRDGGCNVGHRCFLDKELTQSDGGLLSLDTEGGQDDAVMRGSQPSDLRRQDTIMYWSYPSQGRGAASSVKARARSHSSICRCHRIEQVGQRT